jgi:hypothetical protein
MHSRQSGETLCSALSNEGLTAKAGLFHEYFQGDTGAGVGASHQTGWTALVAILIQQNGKKKLQLAGSGGAVPAD